mmetsp:Transcript_14307/g.24423  ORF Transcript_14307/g.24423 Transcript_14307/m.24423 type:complete len:202 (-) Transcript_14307:419-1024(-)
MPRCPQPLGLAPVHRRPRGSHPPTSHTGRPPSTQRSESKPRHQTCASRGHQLRVRTGGGDECHRKGDQRSSALGRTGRWRRRRCPRHSHQGAAGAERVARAAARHPPPVSQDRSAEASVGSRRHFCYVRRLSQQQSHPHPLTRPLLYQYPLPSPQVWPPTFKCAPSRSRDSFPSSAFGKQSRLAFLAKVEAKDTASWRLLK